MTTPRTIAAGTFGGTIGALATAAVQSQASPGAIAAAVQRVQDQKADNTLQSINSKLGLGCTRTWTPSRSRCFSQLPWLERAPE
jgi:hypothetical protein